MKIEEGEDGESNPGRKSMVGRKFGEVNIFVTQMLSGHEYFRKYLDKVDKTVSAYCLYEEGEVFDNTELNGFECACWQSYSSVLTSII